MKKLFAVLLAAVLLTVSCAGAFAVSVDDTVTSSVDIVTGLNFNVNFGEGFYGFCLDKTLKPAFDGNKFKVESAADHTTSKDGSNISNKVKLLFTEYFNSFYADPDLIWPYNVDSNGYLRAPTDQAGKLQNAIWALTNNFTGDADALDIVDHINELDGQKVIPDHGYVRTYSIITNALGFPLERSVTVTFDFYAVSPLQTINGEEQQSFFMCRVSTVDASETDSPIVTPTPTPVVTPTPTPVVTPTPTPVVTPTPTPVVTPTPTPVVTPTPTPVVTPTPTPVVTPTPTDRKSVV